jgi:anti-anti-sigma regulatory factor
VGAVLEQVDSGSLVRLEGSVDIACAAELKELFVEALGLGRELAVSLEATSHLDVTAVQLLWAADREARSHGFRLTLSGTCPESLRESLAQVGMSEFPLLSN